MEMPQKIVYEVKYKLISHTRVNKIKIRMLMYIARLLNLLFKVKLEMTYCGEGIRTEEKK